MFAVVTASLATGGSPTERLLAPERLQVSLPDISTAEGIQAQCEGEEAERSGYPSCTQPNLKCKNATSDWPKCVPPSENYQLRFGQDKNIPIGAWWPPPTHEPSAELTAYVNANFTMVMVGDRDPEGCQEKDHYKDTWKMVMRQLDVVEEHGLQALIDGYVCSSWGGPEAVGDGAALPFFGEEENGPPGAWVDHAITHKPTPREVDYIMTNLRHRKSVVGLLLADDAQDMEGNELNAMAAIKLKSPEIFPWVNQIMDPSHTAWLARAGFPCAAGLPPPPPPRSTVTTSTPSQPTPCTPPPRPAPPTVTIAMGSCTPRPPPPAPLLWTGTSCPSSTR